MRVFAARDGDGRTSTAGAHGAGPVPAGLRDLVRARRASTAPTGTPGPTELRRPDGPARGRLRRASTRDEVAFHAWLQWALDLQLAAATGELTVIQDLPIGVAGGGADAWAWQDVLAAASRSGAAGRVQPHGPGLGLAAAGPVAAAGRRLRAVHPVGPAHHRRRRRAADRPRHGPVPAVVGAAGRLGRPTAPTCATRARTCSTSSRWRATGRRRVVVGEDLGTVEPASARRWPSAAMLSYRLLWFEDDDPAEWPADGDGRDHDPRPADRRRAVDRRRRRGPARDDRHARRTTCGRAARQLLDRLHRDGGLDADATPAEAVERRTRSCWPRAPSPRCCRRRSTTPSARSAGRTCPAPPSAPNWSLPLPVPVEDLDRSPTATRLVALANAGLGADDQPD